MFVLLIHSSITLQVSVNWSSIFELSNESIDQSPSSGSIQPIQYPQQKKNTNEILFVPHSAKYQYQYHCSLRREGIEKKLRLVRASNIFYSDKTPTFRILDNISELNNWSIELPNGIMTRASFPPSQEQIPISLWSWFHSSSALLPEVLLMDGGVSTHLENLIAPKTFSHRDLWSSSLLLTEEGRASVFEGHRDWLDSGSDILTTVTYQCHYRLFKGAASNGAIEKDINQKTWTLKNYESCMMCL